MYKIAILGCENSHANAFLGLIKDGTYTDIEVIGVYSNEKEAAEKLSAEFGVSVAETPDAFVGKVDGVVITARDGRNHLPYAMPYMASGIPMFIDKPITSDEAEAIALAKEAKKRGVRLTGGSSCIHCPYVKELAEKVRSGEMGEIYGGYLRAPVSMQNAYGNFFFYSAHLVQVMQTIFGYYPKSVKSFTNGKATTVVVRYENFDVSILYVEGNYTYYASISTEKGIVGSDYPVNSSIYVYEFDEFYQLLKGNAQKKSYNDFISSVAVICAIERAIASGNEEVINYAEEI